MRTGCIWIRFFADGMTAALAPSGADSFWVFAGRVRVLKRVAQAMKENMSRRGLVVGKKYGVTYKGKPLSEDGVKAFIADTAGCSRQLSLCLLLIAEAVFSAGLRPAAAAQPRRLQYDIRGQPDICNGPMLRTVSGWGKPLTDDEGVKSFIAVAPFLHGADAVAAYALLGVVAPDRCFLKLQRSALERPKARATQSRMQMSRLFSCSKQRRRGRSA